MCTLILDVQPKTKTVFERIFWTENIYMHGVMIHQQNLSTFNRQSDLPSYESKRSYYTGSFESARRFKVTRLDLINDSIINILSFKRKF